MPGNDNLLAPRYAVEKLAEASLGFQCVVIGFVLVLALMAVSPEIDH